MPEWPQADRRDPKRTSHTYAVRAPLARWLREEAKRAHDRYGRYSLLDVGCGRKPYFPFFEPYVDRYVGLDVPGNPDADVDGYVEAIPLDDASFDVVLCAQVLEHADDPARAVSELARVTAPGGRVLASTHGVQVYHPSPKDYWRWTEAGLERLFREAASWASVTVTPASGTASCLAMLLSTYIDLAAQHAHLRPIGRTPDRGAERTGRVARRARAAARARPRDAAGQLPRPGGEGMRSLVTGGAGFIGSNLVRGLLERGDDVRVLDNFSTGSRDNLRDLDVEIVEGELRSYERVHNAVRGVEVVYHLGALGSVPRSVQDPLTSSAVNIEGTLNVLLAARDEDVRRVVFSSSTSVYGTSRERPTTEASPPDPISPYGVAKLAAERYCVSFSRVYETLETVVLRYFNVFGPYQTPFSQYAAVVPLFVTAIDAGDPITIHGDGEQSRDFTYVENVVDATILGGEAAGASGRIFNVAAGSPASVNEIADSIGRILGKPVERRFAPTRAGDIRDSWADISAAREILGYEPRIDLEDGLRRTVEHLV